MGGGGGYPWSVAVRSKVNSLLGYQVPSVLWPMRIIGNSMVCYQRALALFGKVLITSDVILWTPKTRSLSHSKQIMQTILVIDWPRKDTD